MIGLVNAAGTPVPARVQANERSVRGALEEQARNLAPILSGEQAASKVLHTAIEALEETEQDAKERAAPEGEQSDRFAQAELEAGTPTPEVGGQLDVTA
jgi:hypothetical protein